MAELLNPWELLRKYVCSACGAVVTCSCSRDLGLYVLPHQADSGVDPTTQERVAVTEQFVAGVCFDCRGVVPPAYPRARHRGSSSAIHRFYWHELWTRTTCAFIAWCRGCDLPLLDDSGRPMLSRYEQQYPEDFARITERVLADVRAEHEAKPRYDVSRPSDADILVASRVRTSDIPACYFEPNADGKVRVMPVGGADPSDAVSVEEFIAAGEQNEGRAVMFLESRPVQCLFGALMWMWVNDPADERARLSYFGGRDGVGGDANGLIACLLPEDFGSPNHATRRAAALETHLELLSDETAEMLWYYDYWLEPSRPLRQYLWAYTQQDEDRGRELIRVLGADRIKRVLRFLAKDYWRRYCGWPDLLTWFPAANGPEDVEFVEVKSSGDRLSDDQRAWIADNADTLRLPFRLAKVHRTERFRRT